MNNDIRTVTKCKCCGNNKTRIVLKLADTPLEDQFLRQKVYQPEYPLELAFCDHCSFTFLRHEVVENLSYNDYSYNTKITTGLQTHYQEFASSLVNKYALLRGAFAIDLGSNDGTMLEAFQTNGLRVLGVEPASRIAEAATKSGLQTLAGYFSKKLGEKIAQKHGQADVITANYMFANISNISDFLDGVFALLSDTGVFIIQTGYHPSQFEKCMFDYIYHEHYSYFTIKSLKTLLNKHGLYINFIETEEPKGGSVRVHISKKEPKAVGEKLISNYLNEERKNGWLDGSAFTFLKTEISRKKVVLGDLIKQHVCRESDLIGFGASHSTTTLVAEFKLSRELKYIVDDNEVKHDTFSPGMHIPVFSSEKIYSLQPSTVIILAWQHSQTIIDRHRKFLENGGCFIIPLPEPLVIRG